MKNLSLILFFAAVVMLPAAVSAARSTASGNQSLPDNGQVGRVYQKKFWDAFSTEFSDGLAPVEKNKKAGFVDTSGRLVIPVVYDYAFTFSQGEALVKKDGKWFFIDRKGNYVSPFLAGEPIDVAEGYKSIGVKCDDGYRIVTKTGRQIARLPYASAEDHFTDGLWAMKKGGKWGFVDVNTGRVAVPFMFDGVRDFRLGLAPAQKNGKWGYINRKGEVTVALQYDKVYLFNAEKNCGRVEKDGDDFWINVSGQRVADPYKSNKNNPDDWSDKDLERLAETVQGVYIPGKTYPRSKWDKVESFSEGLAQISVNGCRGYIDNSDRLVIAPIYRYSRPFSQGVAAVSHGGGWSFIDKTGRVVATTPYDVLRVEKDMAKVSDGRKYGLIKNNGKVIVSPAFDDVEFPRGGMIKAKRDGKWGYIDMEGNTVIPFQYDGTWYFHEGYAAVQKAGKWGFIDRQGRIAVPLEYDNASFVEPGGRVAQVKKDGKWIVVRLNTSR